jgi:hypothetical protein
MCLTKSQWRGLFRSGAGARTPHFPCQGGLAKCSQVLLRHVRLELFIYEQLGQSGFEIAVRCKESNLQVK